MRKGEIRIVDIPELSGHEQIGTRPAIILSDTQSMVAIVIPCTSNLQALRFPYTLLIKPSKENGLNVSSVALVIQIRAIDKKRLNKKIGFIGKSELQEINKMLKQLLIL